jgi:hypothetical protein
VSHSRAVLTFRARISAEGTGPESFSNLSGPRGPTVRFDPAVKTALEKAAAKDSRTVSRLLQKIAADYLRAEGFLKPQ